MKKLLSLIFLLCLLPVAAQAYQIEDLPNVKISGDFVLGQGKVETSLLPGGTADREISVINRSGQDMTFYVSLEDFAGSSQSQQNVVFLGQEKSPYSLKDFIIPEVNSFSLKHGQKITLPIKIQIPANAQPGGLYGSVIISTQAPENLAGVQNSNSKVKVVARLAALFFVRIEGEANENGLIKKFITDKKVYQSMPVNFLLTFANQGTVYLKPYGSIEIFNIFGRKVNKVEVTPFFSLPGSIRDQVYKSEKNLLPGYYRAVLTLDKSYGRKSPSTTVGFWVLSWGWLIIGLLVLIILVLVIKKMFFRKK